MKKLVIITAITLIPSLSMAKTKVFGELHASYENSFPVGERSRDTIVLKESLIGVKGATEIQTDVSFIYQFTWGISSDNFDGSTKQGINNRNQVIGLASPSGAVVIGRFDTPFKTLGKQADLFWHSQLGQNRSITNANDWDVRADKIIAFQSPKLKGFQTSLAYATDISDTSRLTQNASAISLNTIYQKGKFKFSAAYEQHDLDNPSSSRDAVRLSTVYKQGRLKLVGFYQQENNAVAVTTTPDAEVFGVGFAYKLAAGTLKAQYYVRDIDSTNADPNLLSIGYDYKVSKQSDIYLQTARITEGAKLGGRENSDTSIYTDVDRGLAIGIRYKF